jgi:hypothetical protein
LLEGFPSQYSLGDCLVASVISKHKAGREPVHLLSRIASREIALGGQNTLAPQNQLSRFRGSTQSRIEVPRQLLKASDGGRCIECSNGFAMRLVTSWFHCIKLTLKHPFNKMFFRHEV